MKASRIVLVLTLAVVVSGLAPARPAAASQWTLLSASHRKELSGSIRQGASRLDFSSRVEKGILTSSLTDS